MNRKYYFNNMWWGWVTGGYMLYMSWDSVINVTLAMPENVHEPAQPS